MEWLAPEQARNFGISWEPLQPPRAIPVSPLPNPQRGLQSPPQVIAAWSKSTEQVQNVAQNENTTNVMLVVFDQFSSERSITLWS